MGIEATERYLSYEGRLFQARESYRRPDVRCGKIGSGRVFSYGYTSFKFGTIKLAVFLFSFIVVISSLVEIVESCSTRPRQQFKHTKMTFGISNASATPGPFTGGREDESVTIIPFNSNSSCPENWRKYYCLNGAKCFTVRIGQMIVYNCMCADGWTGNRCEFRDSEEIRLAAAEERERYIFRTASIFGGISLAIFILALISLGVFFYISKVKVYQRQLDRVNAELAEERERKREDYSRQRSEEERAISSANNSLRPAPAGAPNKFELGFGAHRDPTPFLPDESQSNQRLIETTPPKGNSLHTNDKHKILSQYDNLNHLTNNNGRLPRLASPDIGL